MRDKGIHDRKIVLQPGWAMLIYLDINIPHLKIAHLGGNLEMGNIKIHRVGGGFKIGKVEK